MGISIAARKYDFNAAAPFQTSDILNLQPVVKHSVPVCSEAKNLVEMGKAQLSEVILLCYVTHEPWQGIHNWSYYFVKFRN